MDAMTDELRRLLDELGVEYYDHATGVGWRFWVDWSDSVGNYTKSVGVDEDGTCYAILEHLTPEQAIAATVGAEDTYTREECEASFVRGYSLGCLPVGSDPRWDENRQTVDEHMAELGWVRKDAATVGRGNLTAEQVREAIMSADRWKKPMGDTGMTNTHLIIRDDGWRAIADELNAMAGRGTCKDTGESRLFRCSECGFGVDDIFINDERKYYDTFPRYCPNCGAKVVDE